MRRFFSAVWVSLALCLLASASSHDQNTAPMVRLEGRPGDLQVVAQTPVHIRTERSGASLRLVILCGGVSKADPGLDKVSTPVPGGIAIDLPLDADPTFSWEMSGVNIRWRTAQAAPSEDLFYLTEPPAYPLGSGDKIQITVYNVEDMNQTVIVDPNGFVTFPVLDKVEVKGLTVNELQKKMEQLLEQYVKSPQINIQLLEYGSRYVNVLGEVGTPGRIALKGAYRVLDAISQAGGFVEKSGDVTIQRRDHNGQLQSKTFTREDLLAGSKEKFDVYVKDQDVIDVEPIKSVYVTGEVKKPGPFPWNKDMTLLRAITLAGGFDQWANKDRIDILRDEKSGRKVIRADASKIEKGKADDIPLMPNDQVVVRERKFF